MSLIETIQEAISCAIARCAERDSEYNDFTEALALSTQPDALAWALLEEMAERCSVVPDGDDEGDWIEIRAGGIHWASLPDNAECNRWIEIEACPEIGKSDVLDLAACLARAVKEQEGRVESNG